MVEKTHAGNHLKLGKDFFNDKKYIKACEEFQKVWDIDPEVVDFETYKNWGNAFYYLHKYDKAIEKYKTATEIKPDYEVAYDNWGMALSKQKKYKQAIEKYQEALSKNSKYVKAYLNLGNSLHYLRRDEEAIESYRIAIQTDPDNINSVFASHNIAELLWMQGRYKEGWKEWENVYGYYERLEQNAIDSKKADYFLNFGIVLHEYFREFHHAEEIYLKGLGLDPNNTGILTKLVILYLEMMDEDINGQTQSYWKARDAYGKAGAILKEQLMNGEYFQTLLQLGELYLAMEEYDTAKEYLLKAIKKDDKSSIPYSDLGLLNLEMEDYENAVKNFKTALNNREREDFTLQSNLAAAYLKKGQVDKTNIRKMAEMAEIEYEKILRITPYHVESHIGLGEVYTVLGEDSKDEGMFDQAITHFNEGIRIAQLEEGSRILKKKELAKALYSRGYAMVKLYELSTSMKDEMLLQKALEDFLKCSENDPDNHRAKRSKEKLEKMLIRFSPQKLRDIAGPCMIIFLSLFVFALTQIIFILGKPVPIDSGYYALLTFGSLIFMVAGLYLSQITKLKLGTIELEKSSAEITSPITRGIL